MARSVLKAVGVGALVMLAGMILLTIVVNALEPGHGWVSAGWWVVFVAATLLPGVLAARSARWKGAVVAVVVALVLLWIPASFGAYALTCVTGASPVDGSQGCN